MDTSTEIHFKQKACIFSASLLKCCFFLQTAGAPPTPLTKKFYAELSSATQVLEDFLDFHGAKNNKQWFFYRELTAAIRHISLGAYAQVHIANRLVFYDLKKNEEFEEKGRKALLFLNDCLKRLAPVFVATAVGLEIPMPAGRFEAADFPRITTTELLDYNIDDESSDLQKKSIVKIASELMTITKTFDDLGFYQPYEQDEIRRIVPASINEVEIRRFEMLVHNLQSSFDTYVIHGGFRFGNRKLKRLRSHFSIVFHLLQFIGHLLHFYERHLHDAGYKNIYKKVRDDLAGMIHPDALLAHTINYGLYHVCYFLNSGKKLAQEVLNENMERDRIEVGIPEKLGFHSRPSLLVAKIVQHYGGQVELCVGNDRFDASSVLDIQWAGGQIHKEDVHQVVFEGDTRALHDIKILAGVNYGEDSMGKGIPLPPALKYLR